MATETTSEWKEMKLSSGVTVRYGPFPYGMYWDVMARALDEHPDPDPPKRTIEVLLGTEEVDDLDDPAYKADLEAARLARWNLLGQAALDLCVEVVGEWESLVQRAARYVKDAPPEDPLDRKLWFLNKYALRTKADWRVIGKIQRFSQIEDEEVRQRAEFFRGDVEGAEGAGADAPGPAEE